jgi:hypothetical protein
MSAPQQAPAPQRPFQHGAYEAARAIVSPPNGSNPKTGMFGRLFPNLKKFEPSDNALIALGQAMIETPTQAADPAGDNAAIAAGYTYLGQFIDHDITLDTTPFPEREADPLATENFRTPALELDSVYGNGPGAHPFLYERRSGGRLMVGENQPFPGGSPTLTHDLHRDKQGIALIFDPRNDENLIVAQLHLAMVKFHNKVMTTRTLNFAQAREKVTHHYQWIVLHDFLPRIVDPTILKQVLKNGRKHYKPKKWAFIPVEFSVAAYRFGHSMVRETYSHNKLFPNATLAQEFLFTGLSGSVVPVPANWPIDWRRFFETATPAPAGTFNPSRKIDQFLTTQLGSLPLGAPVPHQNNLAVRNLIRGKSLGLPTGQDVAKKLGVSPLTPAEIATGTDGAVAKANGLDKKTPLWYYILKESSLKAAGQRLGPVGSWILSDVFVGLLQMSPGSILDPKNKNFKPDLGPTPGEFTMANLLDFVGELNPVGD